jgi:hypothetical protein
MLEPHEEGDSIYVITDAQDNFSQSGSREKLKEELLNNRVRLFAFLLADQMFTVEERLYSAIMSAANETGGFVLGQSAESGSISSTSFEMNRQVQEKIKAQTAQLNLWLGGFYSLSLTPHYFHGGSHVSVDVVDDKGKRRKGLVVTFPRRLLNCPTALAN